MIEFAEILDQRVSFDEAWLHCLTLDYNGHKDWRMPTFNEYMIYGNVISESWDSSDIGNKDRYYIIPVRDK